MFISVNLTLGVRASEWVNELVFMSINNLLMLVLGIGTLLAVTILSIPQLGTQAISKSLEWLFMTLLPNFCLGQSVSDLYNNFMLVNACQPVVPLCPFLCAFNQSIVCCKGTLHLHT